MTIIPGDDPYLTGPDISISAREIQVRPSAHEVAVQRPGQHLLQDHNQRFLGGSAESELRSRGRAAGFAELSVPVSNHPEWASDATITAIRLDPCDYNPTPGTGRCKSITSACLRRRSLRAVGCFRLGCSTCALPRTGWTMLHMSATSISRRQLLAASATPALALASRPHRSGPM